MRIINEVANRARNKNKHDFHDVVLNSLESGIGIGMLHETEWGIQRYPSGLLTQMLNKGERNALLLDITLFAVRISYFGESYLKV